MRIENLKKPIKSCMNIPKVKVKLSCLRSQIAHATVVVLDGNASSKKNTLAVSRRRPTHANKSLMNTHAFLSRTLPALYLVSNEILLFIIFNTNLQKSSAQKPEGR